MRRIRKLTGRVAARVKRAAIWTTRKLRRLPDPQVIGELQALQAATARQVTDHLVALDAYRRQMAGDDPVKQMVLADIERQAVLTIVQCTPTNERDR